MWHCTTDKLNPGLKKATGKGIRKKSTLHYWLYIGKLCLKNCKLIQSAGSTEHYLPLVGM